MNTVTRLAIFVSISIAAPAVASAQTPSAGAPTQAQPAPQAKRLYVEDRTKTVSGASVHCDTYGNCYGSQGTRTVNVSLEVTREIMKKCPSAVIVTDNHDAADFDLRISPGSSTLYKQNGDAVYISPTRFKVSNLAKDVCGYVESHP